MNYKIVRRLSNYLSVLRYTIKFKSLPKLNGTGNLNDKIVTLAMYADDIEWSKLADKYAVRQYLKEKGLDDMLVPLLGVWKNADDIDFDKLPDRFVMKTNHGCDDVFVVRDKKSYDLDMLRVQMRRYLKKPFGFWTGEPHYLRINPVIIAEQLLENTCPNSSSLVDYKFYCFNGEPASVLVCYDRKGLVANKISYDMDWNQRLDQTQLRADEVVKDIKKPESFQKMIEACRILGEQFKFVRIDFYDVDGKPYFGEMTFTPAAGRSTALSKAYLEELGKKIVI